MTTTDVCVIGAGVAGLTTAYRLLSEGLRVLVVDAGSVGGGESLRTTAHLTSAVDRRLGRLEHDHGQKGARKIVESHAYAIDWIEWLCAAEGIDCGFERVYGYLFEGPSATDGLLEDELAAAARLHVPATRLDNPWFSAFARGPCIRFDAQAQLDPAAYLAALMKLVVASGGRIEEGALVERVGNARDGTREAAPVRVHLQHGRTIAARHVVMATHVPVCGADTIARKQAPHRSYVVTLEVPVGEVPRGLYWDTEEPRHTMRVVHGAKYARGSGPEGGGEAHDTLLVRGEDHRTGQDPEPESCFDRLERWALARFPRARIGSERWSTQVMEPADGIGLVGACPGTEGHIHVITGDAGNGITLATLGARIVADRIAGRSNPWASVYDPSRSMLRAAGPLLRANLNTAMQYLDRMGPGEALIEDEIADGRGAVIRAGATLLAVYRDDDGATHTCSARCPHRGGIVHWNDVEKSWDCPCHGSRFDAYGVRINGPATQDLVVVRSASSDPAVEPAHQEVRAPSDADVDALVHRV